MYDATPPITGGLAGIAVLATTGAEPAVAFVVAAIGLLVGGLFMLRVSAVRRHRSEKN